MADLIPIEVPLTYGPNVVDLAADFTTVTGINFEPYLFPGGKSARMLVWPALKLGHISFALKMNNSVDPGRVIVSWPTTYSSATPFQPFFLVAHGPFTNYDAYQAWGEVTGNQIQVRYSPSNVSEGNAFGYGIDWVIGSITFPLQ